MRLLAIAIASIALAFGAVFGINQVAHSDPGPLPNLVEQAEESLTYAIHTPGKGDIRTGWTNQGFSNPKEFKLFYSNEEGHAVAERVFTSSVVEAVKIYWNGELVPYVTDDGEVMGYKDTTDQAGRPERSNRYKLVVILKANGTYEAEFVGYGCVLSYCGHGKYCCITDSMTRIQFDPACPAGTHRWCQKADGGWDCVEHSKPCVW